MTRLLWSRLNPSLAVRVGVTLGGITLLLAVVLGERAGRQARHQIKQDIGEELTQVAFQVSRELDINIFERYREIQIIAELDRFQNPQATLSKQQALLEQLQSTFPHYSWIGFTTPQGTVVASTQGLLQGANVAQRPWFQAALSEPFVGDVHEAALLAELLPNPQGTHLRFVDVAAPVVNDQGDVQGVIGAHLNWQWAEEVIDVLMKTPQVEGKEVFIVNRDGMVLSGPRAWQGKSLDLDSNRLAYLRKQGYAVETWPNDETYLVGFAYSRGYQSYEGLGWTILVRESTATAFAPAHDLYQRILLGGVVIGGGFVFLSWAATALITRPLLQVAAIADQIRAGNRDITLPHFRSNHEMARLSRALTQLITELLERERDLSNANAKLQSQLAANRRLSYSYRRSEKQLQQIVDGIEDALLLREIGSGKLIYANAGLTKLHPPSVLRDPDCLEEWVQHIHPEDRDWVSEKLHAEVQRQAFFNDEYRILDADGNVRWIWDRSFPICDETGQVYRYVVIKRDVTELKRSAEVLQTLMQGTAAVTGNAFFEKLVQQLAEALRFDHVCITEQVDTGLQTLAHYCRGQMCPSVTYNPDRTPCAITLAQGSYYCATQVQQQFSDNSHLQQIDADGYVAVALVNATGESLGTLAGVSQSPLDNRSQSLTILRIFAHRAAAEIERQRSNTALEASEARFRLLAENIKDLVCLHDLDGKILYASPSCQSVLGSDPKGLIGQSPLDYCHPEDQALMWLEMLQAIEAGYLQNPIVYRAWHQDGHYIWLETLIKVVASSTGEPTHLQTSSRDITDKFRAYQQLEHDATHDRLTGLPNRTLLLERLDLALERARANAGAQFAVLCIDLDQFKVINDSLGHLLGDHLLQRTASTLESAIRGVDLVARWGGDEFIVLLEDISGLHAAIGMAEDILEALSIPICLDDHEVVVEASIGIVLGHADYGQGLDLLRDADIAMYSAKRSGKACYAIFQQEMYAQALRRHELGNALRQALERQEFVLRYQPIIALDTGKLAGFEALVRWQHPERGMISPAEFIPVAEETGLIVPLGTWVLRAACEQMGRWQTQFPAAKALKISVNLSVKQLKDAALIPQVKHVLQTTGLAQGSLALEITESMFMEDIEAINQRLQELHDLAVQISIDDFGTGFSSLSYLHLLAVNNLKIDRSFVSNLFESERNFNVTATIIELANQLGLDAIAEGIETEAQLQQLQVLGCRLGQGYLFDGPVPSETVESLIAQASLAA
ncbi:hypothetical protein XM38_047010 [Halomicronema hongdechloris C2206]|uniref:Uncharacterized protein n=1 Tax=Halomicronema hongdechloris C2206 TaxID=1641165 RepID=A0A1Z3HTV8_9CYAN|nr:EAL domain-containing protein [Halomicronema hongdechloris]ASC73729.1 hypothetical protein XM38_047010 [Halomicronema hongdechloris C2206]